MIETNLILKNKNKKINIYKKMYTHEGVTK